MDQLYSFGYVQESKALPYGRVLDIPDAVGQLVPAVTDTVRVVEKRGQIAAGEIAVFVDRGAENTTAMLVVIERVVGPPSKE
jgi:hypothetical protein